MAERSLECALFPETAAGGFSRCDVRMEYLTRVNALLRPDMVVLEYGAGSGKWASDPVPFRRWLGDFRGRCRKVIGADVDPEVLTNPQVDERILLKPGERIPLPDESVDMISAFSVFEHVEDAEKCAAELSRILRPGGWICAWATNRWGVVGIGARLIPRRWHDAVLRWLEPRREESDSFLPLYRMNTARKIRSLFPPEKFENFSYAFDVQPYYHFNLLLIARILRCLHWATPSPLKTSYMFYLRKRGESAATEEPWKIPGGRQTMANADTDEPAPLHQKVQDRHAAR